MAVDPIKSGIFNLYGKKVEELGDQITNYGIGRFFHKTVRVELVTAQSKTEKQGLLSWLFGNVSGKKYLYLDEKETTKWLKGKDVEIPKEKGNLGFVVKKVVREQVINEQTTENYERILKQHIKLTGSFLDSKTLEKVVRTAIEKEILGGHEGVSGSVVKIKTDEKVKEVLAGFRGNKLFLREITPITLGTGSSGVVKKVNSVSGGNFKAVKWAKRPSGSDSAESFVYAKEDLKNEYRILHHLHGDQKIPGIQKPPSAIVQFKDNSGDEQVGFLSHKYDGDLSKAPNLFTDWKAKINAFTPLLDGMAICVGKKDLLHGDIKPGNIFYEKTIDAGVKLYIGDFGGAAFAKEHKNSDEIPLLFTQAYTHQEDFDQIIEARKTGNYSHFVDVYKKHDVFSLGCTLAAFFTGETRVMDGYNTENGRPAKNAQLRDNLSFDKKMPKGFITLIEDMTKASHSERPTMQEALARWNTLIVDLNKQDTKKITSKKGNVLTVSEKKDSPEKKKAKRSPIRSAFGVASRHVRGKKK